MYNPLNPNGNIVMINHNPACAPLPAGYLQTGPYTPGLPCGYTPLPRLEHPKFELPKLEPAVSFPKVEPPKPVLPMVDIPKPILPKFDLTKADILKPFVPKFDPIRFELP